MGNPESERRAEFYQQSWCHEAVPRYFYTKVVNNCIVNIAGICKPSWFRVAKYNLVEMTLQCACSTLLKT